MVKRKEKNEWMPYNFLLRYDCEIFCAIHIKKHNTSCQKKDDEKKTSNTYYIRTRKLMSTLFFYHTAIEINMRKYSVSEIEF